MSNLWNREPAMIMALVQAVIALATSFGLGLTPEQIGSIMAISAAILGLITRSQVSSKSTTGGK